MEIVRIASNEFLMPNNSAWKSEFIKWQFGEFNDWIDALLDESADGNVTALVMFFDGLFSLGEIAELSSATTETIDALISSKLALLSQTVQKNFRRNFILCTYVPRLQSSVANARLDEPMLRLFERLNVYLKNLVSLRENIFLLDLNHTFSFVGIDQCLSMRNRFLMHCRLSFQGIEVLGSAIEDVVMRLSQPAKKVLALDCDNTIWGGVIGEDGLGQIILGQDGKGEAFQRFQRSALLLKQRGIVLCLLSKNNEADVWDVFDKHEGMILKKSDVVGWRINWQSKAENLANLAEELGLGIDSFVFWDDNPLERAEMKAAHPSVTTIDVPASVFHWPDMLLELPELSKFGLTDDDKKRTNMYKIRQDYQQAEALFANKDEFLKSLAMKVEFIEVSASTIARATQLCQKTNQFNMRTIRYSHSDIMSFKESDDHEMFLVSLSDKFGDHGIVGFFIAHFSKPFAVCFIKNFLLSCRILGRNLESLCLARIIEIARERGMSYCVGDHILTAKNKAFGSFYEDQGFVRYKRDVPAIEGYLATSSEQDIGTLTIASLPNFTKEFLNHFDVV